MEHSPKLPNQPSMWDILRLAASPAGQQLFALMKKQGGEEFQKSMELAAKGDYTQIKRAIESTMTDPQAQKLLKELGG